MGNLTSTTTIDFDAPASEVWKGLTDPAMIKEYFFGTDLKTDWKVGSPIIWSGEWEGKTYEDKGKVLEVKPGKFARYTYWSSMSGTEDKPENYLTISYDLIENGDKTTLNIVQEGIKDEAQKDHSDENWKGVMGDLKKMLEHSDCVFANTRPGDRMKPKQVFVVCAGPSEREALQAKLHQNPLANYGDAAPALLK
ncbi:MAG: hypothetical protein EOO88_54025, partial [Pedobacter sp.]